MTKIPLGFLPNPLQPLVRPMFRSLAIAASGLSAQREQMETIATNIANAETTRTESGTPYRRRVVTMEAAPPQLQPFQQQLFQQQFLDAQRTETTDTGVIQFPGLLPTTPTPLDANATGVRVAGVQEDASEGPLVYDPGHPDANADGYVRMPNVDTVAEMVDLITAQRGYEANVTAMQTAKAMFSKTLDILR
jgi:flagellar basal-body rod protein FlgC